MNRSGTPALIGLPDNRLRDGFTGATQVEAAGHAITSSVRLASPGSPEGWPVAACSATASCFRVATCTGLTFCFSSMALRMRCASAATFKVVDLRSRRTRLPLLWLIKWEEPHRLCDTFPVAEILKRFFIPL